MAYVKISELPAATSAETTDELPANQAGTTVKVTVSQMLATAASGSATLTNKTFDTAGTGNVLKINGTAVSDKTGTGKVVLDTSPALVTPNLGTPSAATLTNATGLPIATGVSGLGTGVALALATNVGSAGAPVVNGGALGTPASGTLTNATGLPLLSGVTGTLPVANGGTGADLSATGGTSQVLKQATTGGAVSVGQLAASDLSNGVTGSGSVVLATSPTLTTPDLGTPSAATLTNATGLPLSSGVTGTLPVANGGTGAVTLTGYVKGSGTSALTASSTVAGSDISGDITGNAANVTGTVAVANGGTGATTLTGYVKGNGTSAFTASSTVAGSDVSGNISGNAANVTGIVGVSNGGTGVSLAATGGTSQVLKQTTTGGTITVGQLVASDLSNGTTGSGAVVLATSPALVTPALGTPSSATLTNATGLPISTGVSGLGTGVATALALNTGSAGAVVLYGGALGTPSSGTATNITGLPVSTGISGLGTGVATALAVNTESAGAVVVNGGALGTPSSGTATNLTGLPVSSGISGLGTGVAAALAVNTGSAGAVVVNGGALGTPSSGTLTNVSGLPLSTGVTGTLSVSNGGTGATTLTGILKGNGTSAVTAVTAPSGTIVGTSDAQTLTSKRIDPRVSSTASASSVTPDVSSYDQYCFTALAATLTINAPTGTPVDGTKLVFRFLDNGTQRTLTWDSTYTAIGVTRPTATTVNKTTYVGCIYNSAATRWDVVAVVTQA